MATYKHNYSFRTGMFGDFPTVTRPHDGFDCEIGKTYQMTAIVEPTQASYYIDGELYATATYDSEDVPQKGYFGFAHYGSSVKSIKLVKITMF